MGIFFLNLLKIGTCNKFINYCCKHKTVVYILYSNADSIFVFHQNKDKLELIHSSEIFDKLRSLNIVNEESINKFIENYERKLEDELGIGKSKIIDISEVEDPALINQILAEASNRVGDEKLFSETKFVLERIEADKLKRIDEDKLIIQYNETLDQLTKVWNILAKRIREFLFVKSPELTLISDDELLIRELNAAPVESILEKYKLPNNLTIDLNPQDEEEFKELIALAVEVHNRLERTRALLSEKVQRLMPKTSSIATPIIAAKLLMLAGSFEKLAMMPSSRIQLLGAEKALFRYLKTGGKLPKYGVLFQHPDILKSDKSKRGKVARKLASKISIALKQDYFGRAGH